MAFEQITNSIKGLTDNTQDYVKVTSEYYKLSLFRNGMKGLVGTANLVIRGTFGILCLVFLSIGLAIYISNQMDNSSAGYFIVAGGYFIIFLLITFFAKKPLERMLLEKYSKMVYDQEKMNVNETAVAIHQASPLKKDLNESI